MSPGDDGSTGTAQSYDIRFIAGAVLDDVVWTNAIQVAVEPTPLPAGTNQTVTVTGLAPVTEYAFAIKAADEAGQLSALSNTPTAKTTEAPPTSPFTFAVYSDSAANGLCSNNADHATHVARIVAANPAFVVHVGDMITGYTNTTNWTQNGSCTAPGQMGSFKDLIAPLVNRPVPPGLKTTFFPTIGNHDSGWGDGWYPDSFRQGVCDAFGTATVRALIPNHTQQPYFRDKTGRNFPIRSDDSFYAAMCSVDRSTSVYPEFFYYSFDYENSHFVVLKINSDYYDLRASNSTCNAAAESNYDTCYNIHQLHWLQDDLAKARANPDIRHIFAFVHAPVFTSGGDHPANASWQYVSQELSKAGADIVFSGHNHNYERTVPIYATAANPGGVRDDVLGTVYIVAGGGGQNLYSTASPAWFDVVKKSAKHHLVVTVNGGEVSVKAVGLDGSTVDSFLCTSCAH